MSDLRAAAALALHALRVTPAESAAGSRTQAAIRRNAKRALRRALAQEENMTDAPKMTLPTVQLLEQED